MRKLFPARGIIVRGAVEAFQNGRIDLCHGDKQTAELSQSDAVCFHVKIEG